MHKISVIIPAYNAEKTIKETIESVIDQSFDNWELLVINDGSTDTTLDIVSKIFDPRIQVLSYPNSGASVSRNRGLSKASGDFITFIDADDLWKADKLEAQYKALLQHPDATVVYSWTNIIDETGKFLGTGSRATWTGDVFIQFLLDDFIGSGSNVMIRRQAFDEVGGFDESLPNAEDTDMWLRLAERYHFVVVKAPQVLYRLSSTSKSSTNLIRLEQSNLRIIEKAFTQDRSANYQHLKKIAIANLYKYLSHKALSVSLKKQNNLLVVKFLWQALKTDMYLLMKPILYKSLLKLIFIVILPYHLSQAFFKKFPRLANTSTFFGYIKSNFP